jgi:hypothetical protein
MPGNRSRSPNDELYPGHRQKTACYAGNKAGEKNRCLPRVLGSVAIIPTAELAEVPILWRNREARYPGGYEMIIIIIAFLFSLLLVIAGPGLGASAGQMAFGWIAVIGLGLFLALITIREIAGLLSRGERESGISTTLFDQTAGTGVNYIITNSQPLPNVIPNELMSNHSNGWTWNKRERVWISDKTGEWGYFDPNGKFIQQKGDYEHW